MYVKKTQKHQVTITFLPYLWKEMQHKNIIMLSKYTIIAVSSILSSVQLGVEMRLSGPIRPSYGPCHLGPAVSTVGSSVTFNKVTVASHHKHTPHFRGKEHMFTNAHNPLHRNCHQSFFMSSPCCREAYRLGTISSPDDLLLYQLL